MGVLKWLILAIIAIIVWAYVRFAYKYPKRVFILQTSLADFNFKLLLEKQPIVVQDRVDDITPIWNGWFRYNINKEFEITPEVGWIRNRYKHMLVHAKEDCEVLMCPPGCRHTNGVPDTTEEVIAVKLYKGMSLVLPFRWYFTVDKPVHACGVHDLVTYVLPA